MVKYNFHTHSCLCDGKDTLEETVAKAIELGFTHLGFSGHSYNRIEEFSMSEAKMQEYFSEVNRLKEKYKDKICIYCGVERDLYSEEPGFTPDYTIASVHFVEKDGEYLPVDLSEDAERENVAKYYGGDFDAYAEDYFASVVLAAEKIKPSIIGHLDLVMKFAERNGNIESERYLKAAEAAIEKLCKFNAPFEMNTGAMARGYRSAPYPSENLLRMIKKYGGRIIISSDCHDREKLNYGYEEAEEIANRLCFSDFCEVKVQDSEILHVK